MHLIFLLKYGIVMIVDGKSDCGCLMAPGKKFF